MRIPFNLPLNSTTMLVAGGIFLLVLFVVVASMGRKSLSGAPGSQSVDDRLNQYAGRTDRNKVEEIKPLAKIDAAVSKGKQGSKIARDLARADLKLTVTEFIGLKILSAVVAAAAGAFIGRASTAAMVLSAIVAGVLLSFAPNLYVSFAAKKRVNASVVCSALTLLIALSATYTGLQWLDSVYSARSTSKAMARLDPDFNGVGAAAFQLSRGAHFGLNFYLHREIPEWSVDKSDEWVFTSYRWKQQVENAGFKCVEYVVSPAVIPCRSSRSPGASTSPGGAGGGREPQ